MKRMIFFAAVFSMMTIASCKRSVENKQKDLLIQVITNGLWLVDFYSENNSNITADFTGYEFQFLENGTVIGTKNAVNTTGTWTGDYATQIITSDFPGASDPLLKLNGTWKIIDSSLDYVKSERITSTGKNILYLKKKV